MNFVLGTSCWHVVGYTNGDLGRAVLLCGWHGNDYTLGGDAMDVVFSDMPVCGRCDRSTGGEASRYVSRCAVPS